jgi:hypothetical protein
MSGDCQYPPLRARRTVGEMPKETKDQAAKRESIRLTKRLKWVLWLPIACVILCAGWLTRMFRTPKSAAVLRGADKERQSVIRRKLRGLPAVHSRGKPAT